MKKRNKILLLIPVLWILLLWAISTAQTSDDFKNSSFYQKIIQLDIPISNILLGNTLTRYDFTRLLNAIECQDCIMPDETMTSRYNEESWSLFQQLPWKYFEDIDYLWWNYNWTNYYYCVANIWSNDIMNWYPRGTSVCWWKFCWQRNVTKAEFFQTLSNFLIDRNMFNYSAQRWEIKKWYRKLKTTDPWYKYLNTAQIALIKTKEEKDNAEQITSRLEFTTYLAYCTFNPWECWFQTFNELSAGNWPIAETNILIRAWIITTEDVYALNSAITPADAVEKMRITYDNHIRCEFDNDYDCDWILNHNDNCPQTYNPSQNDFDGDDIWDVCDDDIDWDWDKNPIWFVDDNWTINYWLLKKYRSTDKTPFWNQTEDIAYFIKVDAISQTASSNVQFSISWPEEPTNVEWDFGDLGKWNWKTISHNFNWQGLYTITAKITTKQNRKHILTAQIYIGQTADRTYNLSIERATINKDTATFEAATQWNYDYLERENKATWEKKHLKSWVKFTTTLKAWVRNNITLKGYANDMLVATASTDVREENWKFYTFTNVFTPLLKQINSSVTTSIVPLNIALPTIENISWNFWDWTSFMDPKLSNKHTFQTEWRKIVTIRLDLSNWEYLFATSTLNIQDPNIIWNQTYNVIPAFTENSVRLLFNNKWLSIKDWDILSATINSQQQLTLDKPKENSSFLELANKQWVVKVSVKLRHWSLTLENNWIITFWLKDQTQLNIKNVDALFSWLKCDLDKDWIPDIYDSDIDWDWIPNLLWLVTKERADCKLVVWENVDQKIYDKHFWICSLDNCPFRPNSDQADLNLNGIWDMCEWNWECWNNIIDLWENCKTCKEDVGTCTAFCWNWIQEPAETCKNCPQDMKTCPSLCWNWIIDAWEECDHWNKNWKDKECTIACKLFDYRNPNCWNGEYDEWETCLTCPVDLSDLCLDDWLTTCWNDKIEKWENCINCPQDVWDCTSFCWNGIVEEAENCSNCPKDVWICTSSCGNWTKEPWEECDNWKLNWQDGKCSKYCEIVDKDHKCWDWKQDEYEQCDKWSNNGKISSQCTKMCTRYNPIKPNCWNWVIDPGETCITCPIDLWEKCTTRCWNWIKEVWEECDDWEQNWENSNCSIECKNATKNCWNKKVDPGENCSNCPTDIGSCTSSCGNWIKEPWEECDNWKLNWQDGKCSKYCKIVDKNHKCWDWKQDEYEQCDKWTDNWKLSSLCTLKCTTYDSWNPNCWNWVIDSWETCATCPIDLWERCSATCWNWIKETWEQCDNWTNNWYDWKCSFECKITTSKCWNNIKEPWEDCDEWSANWSTNSNCTKRCTTKISTKTTCWNGSVEWEEECDLWTNKNWKNNYNCTTDCKEKNSCPNRRIDDKEKCNNCSEDLKEICINDWEKPWECWNKIIEPWETCSNCSEDVWKCSWFCWNWIVEEAEDCSSCPKDVWICTSSCGNWIKEPWEECDNGASNWWDGICSDNCKLVDSDNYCWDWNRVKEYEECDLWIKNWIKGSACTKMCTTYNPIKPNCGNWVIDPGETCITCPVDLWNKCSNKCWDWIVWIWEQCDNWPYNWYDWKCSFECSNTNAICWNWIKEWNEKCDDWDLNWTTNSPNKCSDKCTKVVSPTPVCWNGIIEGEEQCDLWKNKNWKNNYNCTNNCKEKNSCPNNKIDSKETCDNCPADLWEICITDWKKPWECWNWIVEDWETCKNCEKDLKKCTSFCWDWVVDPAEDCTNCTKDVKSCKWSCWNAAKEPWEECDHWRRNWLDGICSEDCKLVDSEHKCWDWVKDEGYEECDEWENNWKPWSQCTLMCTKYIASKPSCGNWVVDIWETCITCPVDLADKCIVKCWNWIKEIWEQCDNWTNNWYDWKCSFECKTTKSICWNGIIESWEDCDDWWDNWTTNSKNNCSIRCTTNLSPTPVCWNGVKEWNEECDLWKNKNWKSNYNCTTSCVERHKCPNGKIDIWETCETCEADLKERCIDDWDETWCWNKIADEDEDCKSCEKDVWKCNAYCGNNKIEAAEDCKSCTRDVGKCTWSCWNGIKEPWEECDNGSNNNGYDWLCWTDCKTVNPNQTCWNNTIEGTEECDDWENNWTIASICTLTCTKKDPLKPNCWNGVMDLWETCNNCPADLWTKCLHTCWDWKINTPREECDNWTRNWFDGKCWFDCKKTTAICWNKIREKWEQCDEGTNNWTWDTCDEYCRKITNPVCWNGKKEFWEECDLWNRNWLKTSICWKDCHKVRTCADWEIQKNETCQTCPEDLWEKCITDNVCWNWILEWDEECDDWRQNGRNKNCDSECKKIDKCWNWKKDKWENCKTCPQDYWPCEAICWNWIIEKSETCLNCPEDVWECTSSCWNGILEEWEQCDHWYQNGKDKKCSKTCEIIVNKNQPYCWDWEVNTEREKCDAWENNWKSSCSYICTNIFWPTSCGNGVIDLWETCMNCALDLGNKCQTKCWNWVIDTPREQCDNWTKNWRDWKCTTECKNKVTNICWNWTQEEWEECDHGKDNWTDNKCTKSCTLYKPELPNCWDWVVNDDENCWNCPVDVGMCWWSCWNGILEIAEECDHWSDKNGTDNLCDKDCRNIDPNKLCWNGYINEDEWEECDDWEQNGINEQCSLNCKKVTRPNCWNGKIENDENCNNCPEDLWVKCMWHCGNKIIEDWEQCDNWTGANGTDWICTYECKDVKWCWNGVEEDDENCVSCPEDVKDECVDHWDTCNNGKIDSNENCLTCPNDTKKCSGSCWNRIIEPWEECDNWDDNWTDNWTGILCSADCKNVDPDHYCWNREIETSLGEVCDLWDDNWKLINNDFQNSCTIDCKRFDPKNPNCWNGEIDEWENCENCAKDMPEVCNKARCWDGIVTEPYEECDPNANNPENIICKDCKIEKPECLNWECNTICNKSIDRDCDWCFDSTDPCPDIAWDPNWEYACCPVIPPNILCLNWDCPFINPICNQCPCQYADYNNTLQKDDQVRARLWDKSFMVHYNYSQMVNISNYIN